MELKEIKKLLDKFYEGETSLEEETLLKNFLLNSDIPEDMLPDKELFCQIIAEQNSIPENKKLARKINSLIDDQDVKFKKSRRISLFYTVSSVAAGIAILVVSYMTVLKRDILPVKNETYDNPQLAYEEVKRTLLFISHNLNRGTKSLNQVSKINYGLNEFSTFSAFSSGLKNIELVGEYYNEQSSVNKKNK